LTEARPSSQHGPGQRLDKWLWHARLFKTRSLAGQMVKDGKIRLNGQRTDKPHSTVRPGDTLVVRRGPAVIALTVEGLAERRGPAKEAQQLYRLLDDGAEPGPADDTAPEPMDAPDE